MKTVASFVAGAVAAAAVGVVVVNTPKSITALPSAGTVVLQHHDGAGRSQASTATMNAMSYDGGILTVTYTSDALFCSAFGQ